MKNLLTATLPALGLLALGGCATSGALTSTTESDGVYYSSADKTTATSSLNTAYGNRVVAPSSNPDGYAYNQPAPATTAPASTDENANPDYYDGTVTNNGIQGANGDYYVTNSYNPSSFGVPYTGPGVSYANYAPVAVAAYGSPYGYGGFGYPAYGGFYSPYAYSAFYDPFYSPWGYGYGSGFSIGFGYGWGSPYYGGFYGSRWGYGYPGYGRYSYYGDPYGYGYGGYGYGYGGYGYGGGYNRPVIYANGTRSGTGDNPILVGPRGGRGGSVLAGGRSGVAAPGTNPIDIGRRNGGTFSTGGVAPAGGQPDGALGSRAGRAATNFGGGQTVAAPAPAPNGMAGAGQPAAQPDTRRGFFNGFFGGNGTRSEGQAASMDRNAGGSRSMSEGQPGMSRRDFSQPTFNNGGQPQRRDFGGQQQQRSFSQPQQPQRSFEQRSFSQPSYSQPSPSRSFGGGNNGGSFGGGGGGGGSFGGGGGGGGRRR